MCGCAKCVAAASKASAAELSPMSDATCSANSAAGESGARAVHAVPDEWEEEDALAALGDLLRRPMESEYLWLLLEP